MTVAFCSKSKQVNDYFYLPLLQHGNTVYGFTETSKLLTHLENKETHLLVYDYDDYRQENEAVFAKLRLTNEQVQIVLTTYVSNLQIREFLVKFNVYGIVPKPVSYPAMLEQVKYYIELLEKNPARTLRKYPRFDIVRKVHNIVRLEIKDLNTFYVGQISNLSLGGMGIQLRKEASPYVIFQGKKIYVNVELDDLTFKYVGEVANYDGGKKIGISFFSISPHDILRIKNFILTLMIHENE